MHFLSGLKFQVPAKLKVCKLVPNKCGFSWHYFWSEGWLFNGIEEFVK